MRSPTPSMPPQLPLRQGARRQRGQEGPGEHTTAPLRERDGPLHRTTCVSKSECGGRNVVLSSVRSESPALLASRATFPPEGLRGGRYGHRPQRMRFDPPLLSGLPAPVRPCRRRAPVGLPSVWRAAAIFGRAGRSGGVSPVQAGRRAACATRGSCGVNAGPRPWDGAAMTDAHMHILRLVARQRRRKLGDDDAADRTGEAGSVGAQLARAATRTTARVTEAQARRGKRRSHPVS